ncbi:MAG: DUF1592 domain-containing protein, partial [Planctomycetes bacterium]|nr:DUF1592 domain-containing protein [Planctomycetota bacterium]
MLLSQSAKAQSWRKSVEPFLQSHCVGCHEGADAEAGLDLSGVSTDLRDLESSRRWILIHDRIASGEMPPKGEPRPSKLAQAVTLKFLAQALTAAEWDRSDVVLRRLNRVEYENTVRELFDVHVRVKDQLPRDTPTAGFDNVGEGLAVSAEAAQAYLRAADIVLDAVFGPTKKPRYLTHKTNLLDQKTHDGKPFNARAIGTMFRKTKDGLVIFQSGYCPTNLVNFARLRAPAGTYRGTIRTRAVQSDKPVTLRVYAGDTIVGRREKHLVGYFDIPPGEWTTIEFTDRLVEAGGTFQPKCYGTKDTRKDADTYPEPGIEIGDITLEGPLEDWPPRSRKQLLGKVDPQKGTLADAREIFGRVLPRAFRRKTMTTEQEPYLALVESALAAGRSFESALRIGLKGILCSPEFLYLDETLTDSPKQLRRTINDDALASRLSYFLWSSMPDEELLRLAEKQRLSDPVVLRGQVERMLGDSKSRAFTENFTGQWLDLREIDFTSPDMNLYPEFDELLRISMVEETHRFFNEVLARDLSVSNFVDSDFTILNERLAKHYGIPGVRGQTFRRVKLAQDSVRGGVLTHASVLKVTANGTTTSPVLRGVWVMENILGQTNPPPPDNVPAVEPDIRGATNLREQLAKHRDSDSCAVCHRKIDPAGFALENFDVIGGWRDRDRTLGSKGKRPDFSRHPTTFAW